MGFLDDVGGAITGGVSAAQKAAEDAARKAAQDAAASAASALANAIGGGSGTGNGPGTAAGTGVRTIGRRSLSMPTTQSLINLKTATTLASQVVLPRLNIAPLTPLVQAPVMQTQPSDGIPTPVLIGGAALVVAGLGYLALRKR